MSQFITFKHIDSEIVLNGKTYTVEEYNTWYSPYSTLNTENGWSTQNEYDMSKLRLRRSPTKCNRNLHADQFGNDWYESVDKKWYQLYRDGVKVFEQPTYLGTVIEKIYNENGMELPKIRLYSNGCAIDTGYEGQVKKDLWMDTSKGEFVPDFASLFKPKYNIGDRVFYAAYKDKETRCGERYQVESFIVKDRRFVGYQWCYYDTEPSQYETVWDKYATEDEAASSVEELKERYPYRDLYMWHHLGGVRVEICPSTDYYMRYIKEQEN